MKRDSIEGPQSDSREIEIAVKRMLEQLHAGKIVSYERGLLKVGATGAFAVEAMVRGQREINLNTFFYGRELQKAESEISLHRYEGREQIFPVGEPVPIRSVQTMGEGIEIIDEIRDLMNEGATFEQAISAFKLDR